MRRGKRLVLLGTVWLAWSLPIADAEVSARSARVVPKAFLSKIPDDRAPVPRRTTTALRPENVRHDVRLPGTSYRMPAEYEPGTGIMVRWGSFNDVLTQVVVGVTTDETPGRAHVVVSGHAQEERAAGILASAGAGMHRVSFIHFPTTSPWMRDYGPRFLAERHPPSRAILSHTIARQRRGAGQFPAFLSRLWGESLVSFPLVHAGGNFHVFSDGKAFATERIAADNPGLKRWKLVAWLLAAVNLDLTVYPSFPENFDSSGHIDMWMLPVADRQVIVGRYPASSGLPHQITEDAARDLEGRGFTVFRTPGWRSRGTHFTYTNALVVNDLVFVPSYERFPERNLEAREVFRRAFPERLVIPVDCSRPIKSGGAVHCLAMHVPKVGT